MRKYEKYKKQVDAEKQTEIDDLMTWHKIDKQRIAELEAQILNEQQQTLSAKSLESELHELTVKYVARGKQLDAVRSLLSRWAKADGRISATGALIQIDRVVREKLGEDND